MWCGSALAEFPSPRGVELHKPDATLFHRPSQGEFPSPRGVELHKPQTEFVLPLGFFSRFRPLAGLSCINHVDWAEDWHRHTGTFPSPRGVELHKPHAVDEYDLGQLTRFPSPRGVELHKPQTVYSACAALTNCFRPLAGLSCINLTTSTYSSVVMSSSFRPLAGLSCINRPPMRCWSCWTMPSFPSPRGVELHKPTYQGCLDYPSFRRFRPLAGLSCINRK